MKICINEYFIKSMYFIQSLFFKTDTKCPFCLSRNYKVIFKKAGIVDICNCQNCDLFWTNPIFKFWKYYDFFYKGEGLTTNLSKKYSLNKLLISCFEGTDKDSHQIIRWLKNISNGKRLLEFGSSWGYFLYQARFYDFEPIGVEISKKRRKFGEKKLGVKIVSNIDELISEKKRFDIIFTTHTLEYLYFIGHIFKKFYNLLTDKGCLVIELPHFDLMKNKEIFQI